MSMNRRRFLHNAGLVLWLPLLESIAPSIAWAAAPIRKKFIGVFSPSGSLMPYMTAANSPTGTAFTGNGSWTWARTLSPLAGALKNNVMILRGVGVPTIQDPHWTNTAGFLSCKPLTLGPGRPTVCGKSFDQIIAERFASPKKSVNVGWKPMNRDFSADHGEYSDRYLETVSWRADDRPVPNIYSPQNLLTSLFTANQQGVLHLQAINRRRKSVLDAVLDDLQNFRRTLSSEDRTRLTSYTDSVREVEVAVNNVITQAASSCNAPSPVTDINAYINHFKIMQQLIAQAMQCDLIASATIMYDDGVGDQYLVQPGTAHEHHGYAHHTTADDEVKLEIIGSVHANLFAHLLNELNSRAQLDQTLVLWGSNMSDGSVHSTDNLPMVLAGAGSDLKFGQEVGVASTMVPKADLFVELASIYGLNDITQFGSGVLASQGKTLGIKI